MVWYIYIPGTQMTPVLIGKDLVLGGLTFKNRGQLGSRQFHGLDLWVCKCRHISQTFHTWSIYDGGLRPPSPPPPPRMGWVQNLRFSYIFMEPAKTHGIYTVLTSSASETVVFAAFCNTTLYTTTLIVLLLQKQQQLLLLPLLRTTT